LQDKDAKVQPICPDMHHLSTQDKNNDMQKV